MHRIDGAGHVSNMFVQENPATQQPPTEVTGDWLNSVQEELMSVLLAGQAIDPSITTLPYDQGNANTFNAVLRSIRTIIENYRKTLQTTGTAPTFTCADLTTGTNDLTKTNIEFHTNHNGESAATLNGEPLKMFDGDGNVIDAKIVAGHPYRIHYDNDTLSPPGWIVTGVAVSAGYQIIYENQPLQPLGAITDQLIAKSKGFLLLDGTTIDLTTNYTQTQKDKLHGYVTGDFAEIQTAYTQNTSITLIDATEYFGRVSDRNLGTLESDAFQGHRHAFFHGHLGRWSNSDRIDGVNSNANYDHSTADPITDGVNGTPRTANETRPKNLAIAKRWGIFIGD